jgi:hypothetical protein
MRIPCLLFPALLTSARNVEVLLWKLKHTRKPTGEPYLVTYEYRGVIDNLSFERLFGKLIVLQEMMVRIAGDTDDRAVSSVLLLLPVYPLTRPGGQLQQRPDFVPLLPT